MLHQATQSITVVDREEIELTDPTSMLDILAGVPGVSIARSGGIGGHIHLRGFSSNNMRSPLYIDGDRLHGRNTLQYQYFAPEEIERVEVIRGPGFGALRQQRPNRPRQHDHAASADRDDRPGAADRGRGERRIRHRRALLQHV